VSKERIHISIDPEIRKIIEDRATKNQRNLSDEIASAFSLKNDASSSEVEEKMIAILAIARKNEREICILKELLNSFFLSMASLQDAEFISPETKKHAFISGAEKRSFYMLREESAKRTRTKELNEEK